MFIFSYSTMHQMHIYLSSKTEISSTEVFVKSPVVHRLTISQYNKKKEKILIEDHKMREEVNQNYANVI